MSELKLDVNKVLSAGVGILLAIGAWFMSVIYEQVQENAHDLAKLKGEIVTREALNGRLDRIDTKIDNLKAMVFSIVQKEK